MVNTTNDKKFAELLLYVAERSESDPFFGAIKLNKILYFAEFEAYRQHGKSITGAAYQNLPQGPAPRALVPVRSQLVTAGEARIDSIPMAAGVQERLVALRHPDTDVFTKEELQIVDEVMIRLSGKTGRELSNESHEEIGWLVTRERETIPFHMALLSRHVPTQADEEFVRGLEESGSLSSQAD